MLFNRVRTSKSKFLCLLIIINVLFTRYHHNYVSLSYVTNMADQSVCNFSYILAFLLIIIVSTVPLYCLYDAEVHLSFIKCI